MSQTTVLIVDDQRPVSQLMERMLTRAGYHVVAAEDAASALALAKANLETLGLAIVDANLGEVHGDEVLAALWALMPTLPPGHHVWGARGRAPPPPGWWRTSPSPS